MSVSGNDVLTDSDHSEIVELLQQICENTEMIMNPEETESMVSDNSMEYQLQQLKLLDTDIKVTFSMCCFIALELGMIIGMMLINHVKT